MPNEIVILKRRSKVKRFPKAPKMAAVPLPQFIEPITGEGAEISIPELDDIIKRMYELKAEGNAYMQRNKTEFLALEAQAIDMMRQRGLKKYDGPLNSGTLVEPETDVIDWPGLEEALPPEQWRLVSRRVGDKELLDAALRLKKVKPSVVKKFISVKQSKPYVLTSERKGAAV